MFIKSKYFLFFLLVLALPACKKFLDEKPDKSLVVPSTLADLQALLDDNSIMNNYGRGLSEACADNYYLATADWSSLSSDGDKQAYIWGDEFFFDQWPNEWSNYYRTVYNTNIVLESIGKVERTEKNKADWDNVKGSALFYRSFIFYNLAITWAKAYDSAMAATDPGIPLRLTSDFNQPSVRASVQETYNRMIADLEEAVSLLPLTPVHVLRPSKPAAYALLSRICLSMRRYTRAGLYADSCLQLKNTLLNYNALSATASFPVTQFNTEVIFHSSGTYSPLSNTRAKIDSLLYASYEADDVRRKVFFKSNNNGTYGFKGNYSGSSSLFYGLAVDEMYLTKAECLARAGQYPEAMDVLNTLMEKRWRSGMFIRFTAANAETALNSILAERRKELLMRGIRWMDIKRLNREGANINIKRVLDNREYTLPPNDNRYALPIPSYIINHCCPVNF